MDTRQLAKTLAFAIDNEYDEIIEAMASHIDADLIEIETEDGEPESLDDSESLWVTSDHTLTYDGETIAEWTRCSCGAYGHDGTWSVEEDTNGGDRLPESVATLLAAIGCEDTLPDVPEPQADEQHRPDPTGSYCVYWETVGDDAGPWTRYATYEEAAAVCGQRNREFAAANPSGSGTTYLCGWSVRELVDGQWRAVEEEE